jgi:hypothetical protein
VTKSMDIANSGARNLTKDQANDPFRIWLWWFLAALTVSQLYYVREIFAAFVLFAIAFVAIAFVVASLYMLQKAGELAVARLAELRHPVMDIANVAAASHKERKAA